MLLQKIQCNLTYVRIVKMWKNRISVVLCIILTFTKFGLSVKLNHRRLISQRNSTTSQGYAKDGKPFQDDYYDYYYDDYYDYYDENDYGFDEFFCEENYDYDRVEYFEGDGYATMFPFPGDCTRAILCFGDRLEVRPCPDGLYFDIFDGVCDERDLVTCWEDTYPDYPEYPDDDERCPPADSNEVVFIPSEYCDSYYICIGGQPVLMNCPNGLHWNKDDNRCEDPRTAGCKVNENLNFSDLLFNL